MPVSEFQTANGITIRIAVDRKSSSGIFGRDFVSGGLRDYFSEIKEGHWVIGKCYSPTSDFGAVLRDVVQKVSGVVPTSMPETAASHLHILLCEGVIPLNETEFLSRIQSEIRQSRLNELLDTPKMRDLRRREAELKEELRLPNTSDLKLMEWRKVTEEIRQERLKQTGRTEAPAPSTANVGSEESSLTQEERSVLVSFSEGLETVGSFMKDNKATIELLASKGLLRRSGVLSRRYQLTEKGKQA